MTPARLPARCLHALADLAFPRNCAVTGLPVSAPPLRYLSAGALASLHLIEPPACPCCGAPIEGQVHETGRPCADCLERRPVFAQGRALFRYAGTGRILVQQLKYAHGTWLLPDLRAFLRDQPAFLDFARGALLVPVPLHPRRERRRGYNQSCLIAEAIAAEAGGQTRLAPLLRRTRDTPTQTRLDRAARLKNMREAFALAPREAPDRQRRHTVVDDVLPTGATLSACAAALRAGGVGRVDALALAHG